MTKDINDMKAVLNTLAPSLGEEGTKTIEDLKEKNMNLFNEKNIFQRRFQKAFQNRKDLEVVFQITIDNYKQIILKKNEAIQKGNRTIADLRYRKKGIISPSTLNFAPINSSLGIYTLHIPLEVL